MSFLHCCSYSLAFNEQDVYEDLWTKSKDIADKTLHVDFMQQMQNNSLQAERYINFTLQDINYLAEVTNMLKTMSKKVKKPKDISDFLIGRHKSYKSFLDMLLLQYFFKDTRSIKPTPAMKKYLDTYRAVMAEDPIYFGVALLPCARLWVWLANNLDIPKSNVYYTWKVDNMSGHPEKHYKNILNKYLNTAEKINNATALFRKQMQNEHDFFVMS
ncbi:hypothetical protein QTP70_033229 [Hemibagrus guttatus]|uniref:Uncharacterized protein n=1 Tax=Hemibagrus guttatus TaxID=175788 RepID=A0AAE0QBC5_9TELE|nr:hypothetical protein QTP70_033229 [Hemibagrus guttatus]KAK3544675.1 hypothetical protein QTP86_026162 [Hemibagrus guttatus]